MFSGTMSSAASPSFHMRFLLIVSVLSWQGREALGFLSQRTWGQRRCVSSSSRLLSRPTAVATQEGDDVCTIQILMSDTGGGHRASANALRDAFDILYPNRIQCDIVDLYTDYGPFWPYNDYVRIYKFMAEYDFLWDIFYHFGATPLGLWLNEFLLTTFCFESFKECLNRPSGTTDKRADMVVSVHPLCQDVPLKILAELDSGTRDLTKRTTPFATVVTDLGGAHPTWFNPGVDKCFVPTDVLYDRARDRKLEPSQLVEHGLPIREGFWSTESLGTTKKKKINKPEKSRSALRQELGLDPALPAVLVVGGGDGMGGIVDIAKALGEKLGNSAEELAYQMVVVCGKNEKARKKLMEEEWGDGVDVLVQGFVYNMDEWMRASDALVTKAGPGTIAEASICGLPCMLFNYLPGQEAGNVPYVEESGFGAYSKNPEVIADTVSSWLSSPEIMAKMKEAALDAARPEATLNIARDLAEMVFVHKAATQPQKVATAASG